MSSKSWAYTLNNYTEKDIEQLKELDGVTRHRSGKEVGDSGTPHLQGQLTFRSNYRLSQLKMINSRCNWSVTKAVDHSNNYCGKEQNVVIDITNNKQGKRNDISCAVDLIKSGKSMREVAEECPEVYIKYNRGMEKLQQILKPKIRDFETEVIVIIGEPGLGKTRRAYEIDPDLYSVAEPDNNKIWYDGYDGEKTILFDDFNGWGTFTQFMKIMDRKPMIVPVKGAMVKREWTRVIITSNWGPLEWWPLEKMKVEKALLRRITNFITMSEPRVLQEIVEDGFDMM